MKDWMHWQKPMKENHSIMRFHHYNPNKYLKAVSEVCGRGHPLIRQETGLHGKNIRCSLPRMRLMFLKGGGPYSKDELKTYSFYPLNETRKIRTMFDFLDKKKFTEPTDVDEFYVN